MAKPTKDGRLGFYHNDTINGEQWFHDGTDWIPYTGQGITNDATGTTSTVGKIWAGTQAEYDAITHAADIIYMIK